MDSKMKTKVNAKKESRHSKAALLRYAAAKLAKKFDTSIDVGEFISQKWLTGSVGIKLSPTKSKRKYHTKDLIDTYKLRKTIFDWEVDKFYNFYVTVLWVDHPDKSLCGTTQDLDAFMVKKLDEKKVPNKKM